MDGKNNIAIVIFFTVKCSFLLWFDRIAQIIAPVIVWPSSAENTGEKQSRPTMTPKKKKIEKRCVKPNSRERDEQKERFKDSHPDDG